MMLIYQGSKINVRIFLQLEFASCVFCDPTSYPNNLLTNCVNVGLAVRVKLERQVIQC